MLRVLVQILSLSAGLFFLISIGKADPTSVYAASTGAHPSREQLGKTLRDALVQFMPRTLHESSPGWGVTKRVPRGVKWTGQGLKVRPEILRGEKNDGTWRKLRVTAENLPQTLVFEVRGLDRPQPGKTVFDAFLAFDVRVDYQQQNWESGLKLYDGSAVVRFRVLLAVKCEATTRLKASGGLLPDLMLRLRVLQANLRYDNFKLEHLAGVGGDAAELIGDTGRWVLRRVKPSLERDLLAKANAAIVKAGDTREVRLGLGSALRK
jgi:hypothetical protein